ncbi:hypothetical protein [Alsobacter sp. R-9]
MSQLPSSLVDRIRADLATYRRRVAMQPDRVQRVAALQFLLKQSDLVSAWLRKNPSSAKAALSDGFLPLLGLMLSPYGMERLLGSIGWSFDERAIEDGMARRGRGDVVTFDRLTHVTRQSVAVQAGPLLLAKLIETLREPLEQALRMEKRHKGGRPQDVERNYVVDTLAGAWEVEHGTSAPSGKTGPFYCQCRKVLVDLNLNTDGLADCIRRTVRRRRSEQTRARQNPR